MVSENATNNSLEGVTQRLPCLRIPMSSYKPPKIGAEPVREAKTENHHQIEYIIDGRSSTQFYRTMMTDHHIEQKPQHNNPICPITMGNLERHQAL